MNPKIITNIAALTIGLVAGSIVGTTRLMHRKELARHKAINEILKRRLLSVLDVLTDEQIRKAKADMVVDVVFQDIVDHL